MYSPASLRMPFLGAGPEDLPRVRKNREHKRTAAGWARRAFGTITFGPHRLQDERASLVDDVGLGLIQECLVPLRGAKRKI